MTVVEPGQVKTEIRVEGVFDIGAARRLAAALDEAHYADVRIDLTGVREFHGFAVALLAEAVASRSAPTSVRGLAERHLRVLRHLGLERVAAAGAAPDPAPR